MMLFQLLFAIVFSLANCNLNQIVIIEPSQGRTFEVDQVMPIKWKVDSSSASSSPVMIEILSDRPDVLLDLLLINENGRDGQYDWKIPRYLKSSNEYRLKLTILTDTPDKSTTSFSKSFSLINANPYSQSTLNVLEPSGSPDGKNLESTCLRGEQCQVLWDYPAWASTAMPKTVEVVLYNAIKGTDMQYQILQVLARDIPVTQKSFSWQVPKYASIPSEPEIVFIAVMASNSRGIPHFGFSSYSASSGFPFKMESRAEREERRLQNSRTRDFTEPGPISVISNNNNDESKFLDVPRPTFASDSEAKNVNESISITSSNSASKASSINSLFFLLSIMSLLLLF